MEFVSKCLERGQRRIMDKEHIEIDENGTERYFKNGKLVKVVYLGTEHRLGFTIENENGLSDEWK